VNVTYVFLVFGTGAVRVSLAFCSSFDPWPVPYVWEKEKTDIKPRRRCITPYIKEGEWGTYRYDSEHMRSDVSEYLSGTVRAITHVCT